MRNISAQGEVKTNPGSWALIIVLSGVDAADRVVRARVHHNTISDMRNPAMQGNPRTMLEGERGPLVRLLLRAVTVGSSR